uniref:Uncharacterized protein n=1 Tax=Rousettus aegyptiacus TaxID=9407 RepID=A0A7J8IL46_ROUAE|nr:hypothetical protein HJG63_010554 [Rousettus aegyptiacus]
MYCVCVSGTGENGTSGPSPSCMWSLLPCCVFNPGKECVPHGAMVSRRMSCCFSMQSPGRVPGRSHRGGPHLQDILLSKDTTCMLCHTSERRGGNEGDNTESLKSHRPAVFSDNYPSFSFLRPYLFSKTHLKCYLL